MLMSAKNDGLVELFLDFGKYMISGISVQNFKFIAFLYQKLSRGGGIFAPPSL